MHFIICGNRFFSLTETLWVKLLKHPKKWKPSNETLQSKIKTDVSGYLQSSSLQFLEYSTNRPTHLCHSNSQTHTHINAHSNSMRLKVVVLIEYINLTTYVIDQKANSSSIIVLEGKTIAKWLCEVHSLGKQIWDPLKPWRLSSLSPTICGDCSEHLAADLPHPVESQWETWQGARQRHKQPLHFNYTAPQWLEVSLLPPQPPPLLLTTTCLYRYLRATDTTVQMCHSLISHDATGHTQSLTGSEYLCSMTEMAKHELSLHQY